MVGVSCLRRERKDYFAEDLLFDRGKKVEIYRNYEILKKSSGEYTIHLDNFPIGGSVKEDDGDGKELNLN